MNARKIAHPHRLNDACEGIRRTADVQLDHPMPSVIAGFCLATSAHKLLRAIYGNSWAVAWACLWYAVVCTVRDLEPLWLLKWRLRDVEDLDLLAEQGDHDDETAEPTGQRWRGSNG